MMADRSLIAHPVGPVIVGTHSARCRRGNRVLMGVVRRALTGAVRHGHCPAGLSDRIGVLWEQKMPVVVEDQATRPASRKRATSQARTSSSGDTPSRAIRTRIIGSANRSRTEGSRSENIYPSPRHPV